MSRIDSMRRTSILKAADISKEFDALVSPREGPVKQTSFDVENPKPILEKVTARVAERKSIAATSSARMLDDPDRISYTPTNTVQRKLQRKLSTRELIVEDDMSYKDLQNVERKRMEYRTYSFIEGKDLLFRYTDTVLMDLMQDANFWLTGIVYCVFKFLVLQEIINHDDSPMVSVATLGGFISFLLVFFLNECYLRYKAQYLEQVRGMNTIVSIAEYSHSFISNKDRVHQLVRYLNVAHIVAYTGMTELYAESNLLVPMVEEFNLLTRKELELIRSFDSDDDGKGALACIVYWAHDVIRQSAKAGEIPTKARANITQHIELFRQTMFLMFSYQELSVPFNYIHLVELLSTIYCPLFAMAISLRNVTDVGMLADLLVITIVNIFIYGVYRIARKLQDAIGGDVEDLSVLTTCRECIKLCKAVEQLPTLPEHNPAIERRLELGQETF